MKKGLLVFLTFILVITLTGCGSKKSSKSEKEETQKKKTDENYVIYYKDTDVLDQIPTKEYEGVKYKSFSVKTGDELDVYAIVYNDTENDKGYAVIVYGTKDDDSIFKSNGGFIPSHSVSISRIHYDNADGYSINRLVSMDVNNALPEDIFTYEEYMYEKNTLKLYYTFNGEAKAEAKVHIIGVKDGEIIGVGEADMKKATDEGTVEKDGVIASKGDKVMASFQSIKLNFDLDDTDQIVYFVSGRYVTE